MSHLSPRELTVRPAEPSDVDALRSIAAAAYQPYVARIGRAPAPMTADYAQAVRAGQTWVAVEDGQVAGFAVLVAGPGYLLLENVAVRPAAQGRGIGSRLLGLADEQARRLGLVQSSLGEEPGQMALAGAGQVRLVFGGRIQRAHCRPEHGQRPAAARVVPHAGTDDPAGPGHPAHLPQAQYRIGHEVDDQLGQRGIEDVIRERQPFGR